MPISNLRNRGRRRLSVFFLLLLIFLWGVSCGLVMAKISTATTISEIEPQLMSNVDVVPKRHQLGLSLYLKNCTTCHIPVPPQVLPTESWKIILEDEQHYGIQLPTLIDPPRQLIWNYLQVSSRPKSQQEERIPYRISSSRYFKALHPRVELPQNVNIKGCVSCHPSAAKFDFRTLNSEWPE